MVDIVFAVVVVIVIGAIVIAPLPLLAAKKNSYSMFGLIGS